MTFTRKTFLFLAAILPIVLWAFTTFVIYVQLTPSLRTHDSSKDGLEREVSIAALALLSAAVIAVSFGYLLYHKRFLHVMIMLLGCAVLLIMIILLFMHSANRSRTLF